MDLNLPCGLTENSVAGNCRVMVARLSELDVFGRLAEDSSEKRARNPVRRQRPNVALIACEGSSEVS